MNLIEKMRKRACIGIFSKTTDSAFVEAAGYGGLDFIILDMEHGPTTWETLHNHVRAAKLTGVSALIRVKGVDAHAIGAALDTGAAGVQIPNINNAEQAEAAVKAARFYPLGSRGVCRFVRAAEYGRLPKQEYFESENKKIVVLQVEGVEGVNNLDAILEVKGFDVLFVGPYDLSQSVGKPGQVNSPEVLSLIKQIANKTKEKQVLLGGFSDTPENLKFLKREGFQYIAYSVDVNLFFCKIKSLLEI
jgi:4-hydroxy-2-oxoheptanedioate aldolase